MESTLPVLTKKKTNMILLAVLLSMFVLGFSMFKLLPMQEPIQDFFGISVSSYGWLNTAQNWFVIIFTVPMGFFIRKVPCKWSMALSFVLMIGGALMQVYTTNYLVFVIGRMLEGGGFGFISLVGNSLTANLVKPEKVGFWISIMVTIAMVGQVIHTRVAAYMMYIQGLSFQTVFLAIIILQIVVFAFWMFTVPGSLKVTGNASAAKPTKEQTLRVYKNASNWLVSIALIFFNMAVVTFSSFIIRYLVIRGMDPNSAATTYSYTTIFGIFAITAFGWLSDKFKTKRKLAVMSFFAGVVALLLLVHIPIGMIMVYVVVFGTLPRSVAGMSNASANDIAEVPADIPIVNSFRNTVSQAGSVVGGIIIGYLIQYVGYEITIYALCVCMALGGVCWIFAKRVP